MRIADKSILLFDMDGTLIDSRVGVTRAVQYSLAHFGITADDPDGLVAFIGPPLRDSYLEHYGFTGDAAETAMIKFREYYGEHGVHDNVLYPGMDDLLKSLYAMGKTLVLATAKIESYAHLILEDFGLTGLFSYVSGAEPNGHRARKADNIRHALDIAGVTDLSTAVMIGDSRYDAAGAHAVGLDMIGVLYGFGTRAELEEAGADAIAESVGDLAGLLGVSIQGGTD